MSSAPERNDAQNRPRDVALECGERRCVARAARTSRGPMDSATLMRELLDPQSSWRLSSPLQPSSSGPSDPEIKRQSSSPASWLAGPCLRVR
jgi:hypothetical protein